MFSDARMEPYYYAILFSFLQLGYQVNLFVSLKWLAGTGKWIRLLLGHPLLHLKSHEPSGNNRIITDKKKYTFSNQCFLSSNAFNNTSLSTLSLPFPMHPDQYASGRYQNLSDWQTKTARPIRIMFSGNVIRDAYENVIFSDFFKIPNRWQIVEYIKDHLNPEKIKFIESAADWQKARDGRFQNQLVMGRWEWSVNHQKNFGARIPNTEWLPTLGKSSFFIACPGVVIPNSHNCIEAMAMGAIPILSYGNLFYPPLVDGINCLSFASLDELELKIGVALTMDEENIAKMRVQVLAFYHEYLTPDACVHRLTDINSTNVTFFNEVT